jgi:hypothetical protein
MAMELTPLTARDARALLDAERKQRAETCRLEISKILETHGCIMEAQVLIRGSTLTSHVLVLATDQHTRD